MVSVSVRRLRVSVCNMRTPCSDFLSPIDLTDSILRSVGSDSDHHFENSQILRKGPVKKGFLLSYVAELV